jgi:hypothetical protein
MLVACLSEENKPSPVQYTQNPGKQPEDQVDEQVDDIGVLKTTLPRHGDRRHKDDQDEQDDRLTTIVVSAHLGEVNRKELRASSGEI